MILHQIIILVFMVNDMILTYAKTDFRNITKILRGDILFYNKHPDNIHGRYGREEMTIWNLNHTYNPTIKFSSSEPASALVQWKRENTRTQKFNVPKLHLRSKRSSNFFGKWCKLYRLHPRPPPPEDGVRWALSGAAGGGGGAGAVAVVDLGDAPRWLSALHSRALAPFVLWRAPARSRKGCTPQWLEKQRGYVLAARSPLRLNAFLREDTREAINDIVFQRDLHRKPHLQLSSSAPVVMSLKYGPSSSISHLEPTEKDEELEALHLLWKRHQSFRGLLLRQGTTPFRSHWRAKLLMIPKTNLTVIWGHQGNEGEALAAIQNLSRLRERDMGNAMVVTFLPQFEDYGFELDTGLDSLQGTETRMMNEIAERLHFVPSSLKSLFRMQMQMARKPNWSAAESIQWLVNVLAVYVNLGEVDLSPVLQSHHPDVRNWETIPSTSSKSKTLIAVPNAPPLPAWSLPLRVWGERVWAWLAGACAAYALAWRVVAGEALAASVAAALRAFSSCGGPPQERVRDTPPRLQLAAALLASAVVVTSVYQGRLFTLMHNPEFFPEIDTFSDLADAGLPVLCLTRRESALLDEVDPEVFGAAQAAARRRVSRLERRVVSVRELLNVTLRRERVAWLMRGEEWDTRADRKRFAVWLHPLKDVLNEDRLYWHSRTNWPWTRAVNEKVLQLHASGLVDQWEAELSRRVAFIQRTGTSNLVFLDYGSALPARGPRTFGLQDVRPHLQLLVAGAVLAAGTFCAELLLGRSFRRENTYPDKLFWPRHL